MTVRSSVKKPTVSRTPVAAPPTTAPLAPQAPTWTPCGWQVLKANGTPWSCAFADDFTGNTLDRAKWVPHTFFATGWPTFTCYRDDPANISVSGGSLHLTVRKEPAPYYCPARDASTPYSAGMVSTWHLFSQQYGRFEARIRQSGTGGQGLHDAFWLWPDERYSTVNWPQSGEIDIAELYSVAPSLMVPFLHYSLDSVEIVWGTNAAADCSIVAGGYNTYTLEWSPSKLQIFVNGKSCLVNTSGDPAFKKRYIMSLTAGLGDNTNVLTSATPIPATLDVDYVRVWK